MTKPERLEEIGRAIYETISPNGQWGEMGQADRNYWRSVAGDVLDKGLLVPRDQGAAAVAAALEMIAGHKPYGLDEVSGNVFCGCGIRLWDWKAWLEHIRSLAKQDALAAFEQRVRLEEAEWLKDLLNRTGGNSFELLKYALNEQLEWRIADLGGTT